MDYEQFDVGGHGAVGYRYCGSYPERKTAPGTDVAAVFAGDISMTPLGLDRTERGMLGRKFEPPRV